MTAAGNDHLAEPHAEPLAGPPEATPEHLAVGITDVGAQVTLAKFEVLDGDAGRSLGKGSFGVVRKVRHKDTGDVYALKTMRKLEVVEGELVDQVEREVQVQNGLKHENVLRLYKHFEDADTVYLLLEYCAKGELYQLLRTCRGRRFTEDMAKHYFVQVARGLGYLHSQSIVHRDLKPENLLVNHDDVLKIADFGWCAVSSVTRTTFCGTLDYLAPEMIQGRGHNHTLDIWSLGVLLYEMVVGRPPFQSTNHVMLIQKILNMHLRFPAFVPNGVSDLVMRLLQQEPRERLPLDQVLSHWWVVGPTVPVPTGSSLPVEHGQLFAREASPSPPTAEVPPRGLLQPSTAACRAASVNQDEALGVRRPQPVPALQPQLVLQASPREGSTGGTTDNCVPPPQQHQAQPSVRPQPPSTPSAPGCRAVAAQTGRVAAQVSAVVKPQAPVVPPQVGRHNLSAPQTPVMRYGGMHTAANATNVAANPTSASNPTSSHISIGSNSTASASPAPLGSAPQVSAVALPQAPLVSPQVGRHNLSAPQTPVQQVRGIRTVANATRVSADPASVVVGAGCNTMTSVSQAPLASVVEGRSPQTASSRRKSRGESPGVSIPPPTQSPTRRPRSSGLSQQPLPTRGIRTELSNAQSSQGLGTAAGSVAGPAYGSAVAPAAPATPAQQQRILHPRVAAANGYPLPKSPKPVTAGRSLSPGLSPVAPATVAPAGAVSHGHRVGSVAHHERTLFRSRAG